MTVLCFGDSITRGVGDGPAADSLPPAPAGYPARLQPLLLPETKLPLTVIDDGKPGERTPDGLVRLRRDLERNTPDYTLLLEGTNDVEDGYTSRALANMQLMIDSVFQTGGMPLLGTITPSCCAHKNQLPEGAVIAYNDQLRAIALNDSIPIVDFYAAFTAGPNPGSNSDPDAPYDSTLSLWKCRLCGFDRHHRVSVLRKTGARYETPFFACSRCSVMFLNASQFDIYAGPAVPGSRTSPIL